MTETLVIQSGKFPVSSTVPSWTLPALELQLLAIEPWTLHFYLCGILISFFVVLIYVNYFLLSQPLLCDSSPYDAWIDDYFLLLLGVSSGQAFFQAWRIIVPIWIGGDLRHPKAVKLIMLICLVNVAVLFVFYSRIIPFTCIDAGTVKTPLVYWIEWTLNPVLLFFLVAMMDSRKQKMTLTDLKIEMCYLGCLLTILLTKFRFPLWLSTFFYIISFPGIISVLYRLYANSLQEYTLLQSESYLASAMGRNHEHENQSFPSTSKILKESPLPTDPTMLLPQSNEGSSFADKSRFQKELDDRFQMARTKINASIGLCVGLIIYFIFFNLRAVKMISEEVYVILISYLSFLSQNIFIQILITAHIEVLDPNKMVSVMERKEYDQRSLNFFRFIFHEIRVPLNSISLGLLLLQDNEKLVEEEKETISMVKESTKFMSETLNDVISLQKLEDGLLQLEFKVFPPSELTRSLLFNFKPQYEAKSIEVTSTIDDNVPELIYADQFRLEHVLANLLSNAIKFSDPHSVIEVRVSYNRKVAGYVTFSVKDEGVGMSAEDQKQLFQPFKQIRPGELQKGRGSGLGLSICKMIVTLHEGTIGCVSKKREVVGDVKSGGSEFFFNIKHDVEKVEEYLASTTSPLWTETVETASTTRVTPSSTTDPKSVKWEIIDEKDLNRPPGHSSNGSSNAHSSQSSISSISEVVFVEESDASDELTRFHSIDHYKMLIVDDVLSNRKMLQMVMKRRGFDCDQAINGREAVDMVESKGINFYQIIFMDALMPVMNGSEASKAIRELGYRNLIIGVTGNAMESDVPEFESNGIDVTFIKPMKKESIDKLLEYCLLSGCQSRFGSSSSQVPSQQSAEPSGIKRFFSSR